MAIIRDYAQYLRSFGSDKFRELWPAQGHVLNAYADRFAEIRDVGIELPTGAGKTLIALLIAGTWLKEGHKVAILSANKTLARQMRNEGWTLGLPVAYMEGRGEDIPIKDRRYYQRAQAIGIMNYWVYFNQNPVVDPSDLLIMDDAHLAEHCLHSLYSVEVTRKDHPELFTTIVRELYQRFPDYALLADALTDDVPPSQSAELVSFIDHIEITKRIREIVDASSAIKTDADLRFRWSRTRPKIVQANLYISRDSIWFRPYIYPTLNNAHYADPQQVLYMSATIGEPGDLARRLGIRRLEKIPVPSDYSDRTSGRRLVIMNRTNDDSDIPRRMARALLEALHIHPKALWLCASDREATLMREAVTAWLEANDLRDHQTWILTSLGDEIDHFRNAQRGHLFVAGRFDGMDFSKEQCRIVIVSTLPRAVNVQELFITTHLRDNGFMRRRLNQRIVQALGRCNRADDDTGVYFLADQRFTTHFAREANREGLPQHIAAEIDLGQDLAEQSEEELSAYVSRFLRGEFQVYDSNLAELREGIQAIEPRAAGPDTSDDEITAWNALFHSENYTIAEEHFARSVTATKEANLREIAALHGWHQAKALYLEGERGDRPARERALQVLDDAIRRGGQTSWFNRMRASVHRARGQAEEVRQLRDREYAEAVIQSFDDHLERLGSKGPGFQKFIDSLSQKLSSKSHAEYLDGLEQLGALLGYNARRPRYGASTDCTWRGEFGNEREYVTFECKIEHTPSNSITANDLGQAHNQNARAIEEYNPRGYSVRAAIVTHLAEMARDAQSSVGTIRLIHKESVLALWNRTRQFLTEYRSRWDLDSVDMRREAAKLVRARLPASGWLERALEAGNPWVSPEELLRDWDE